MTDGKNPRNKAEIMIKVTMVVGAMLWASVVFLRQTSVVQYSVVRSLLGLAPNFGVVWVGFGLTYTIVFPVVLKRKFDLRYSVPLILIILALLLASEIIHDLFLNAPFDVWDMVASVIAAVLLWLALVLTKQA